MWAIPRSCILTLGVHPVSPSIAGPTLLLRPQALIDNFLTCVVPLSSHPFGCRIIQRILEHCSDDGRKAVVMEEILKAAAQLAQDQYGNYVIQHVLERGTPAERSQVRCACSLSQCGILFLCLG